MRRSWWAVVVTIVVGACNFKSSLNSSSTTPSGGTSSTSTSSDSSSAPTSGGDPNERAPMINLMGKTPDEATTALRAAGFSGEIEVNRHALVCEGAAEVPGRINCQSPDVGQLAYRRSSVNVTVYETPTHAGRIIPPQLDKMIGMTIPEAKKYLKSIGHTGTVEVREDGITFHKGCAKDRVCDYGPAGLSPGDPVTLIINKTSTDITMPD